MQREGEGNRTRRAGQAGGARGGEEVGRKVARAFLKPLPSTESSGTGTCLETRSYIPEQSAPWHAGRDAVWRCMRARYSLLPFRCPLFLLPHVHVHIFARVSSSVSPTWGSCRVTFLAANVLTSPHYAIESALARSLARDEKCRKKRQRERHAQLSPLTRSSIRRIRRTRDTRFPFALQFR